MKKSLVILVVLAFAFMATAAMADIVDVRYNTRIYENSYCSPGVGPCFYVPSANHTYETWTDANTGDTVTLNYYGVGNPGSASYADAFIGPSGVSGAQFGQFNITTTGNHGELGLSSAIGQLGGVQWQ